MSDRKITSEEIERVHQIETYVGRVLRTLNELPADIAVFVIGIAQFKYLLDITNTQFPDDHMTRDDVIKQLLEVSLKNGKAYVIAMERHRG